MTSATSLGAKKYLEEEKTAVSLFTSVPFVFIVITCMKLLLIPSYRSTDFDVHRNWLATTRHIPLSEWYSFDLNGQTRHTLDYPPMFAFFEYFLSLWKEKTDRCLALLPDDNNEPSWDCVMFQRMTVIGSDMVLLLGSYMAAHAIYMPKGKKFKNQIERDNQKMNVQWTILLILCHPGLLILDHIHFQYNGMLLGILLTSIACIINGNILMGAASYTCLVTFKHLYATLGPIYLIYLLRHYCFSSSTKGIQFCWSNFLKLAIVTAFTLLLPFLPFILTDSSPKEQLQNIFQRLFPFGRGLVHEYWAANIWALHQFGEKILTKLSLNIIPSITPAITAVTLLLSLVPAMYVCWKSSASFLYAIIYAAFSSFMLSWHVHEKAIMTALVPLTLLACSSPDHSTWFLRTHALGIFALFPLLFRPVELLCKSFIYVTYGALAVYAFQQVHGQTSFQWNKNVDCFLYVGLALIFVYMEVLHPLLNSSYEFLPLLLTSVYCAFGLIYFGWIQSFSYLIQLLHKPES